MIDLILGPIGAIAGAVLAIVLAYFTGRSSGKKGAEHDAYEDHIDRVGKGRDAVRDGRDRDPADRLRENDDKW